MLAKIVGVIWILLGILWLIKPEMLKNRLQRKMTRRMKWIIYGFMFIFALSLVVSALKAEGLAYKIVGIIGIIIFVKIILLLMSKASEKFLGWWQERPLIFFRIFALLMLGAGIMLMLA